MIRIKPLPTIKQLRYLVALADYHHFGKAAEASLATQSTLSTSLSELEDLLGVTLVERTNRKVMLSSIGKEIVLRARDILLKSEELYDVATHYKKDPLQGEIKLGIIPTIAPYILPMAIPLIKYTFPKLRLTLRELMSKPLLHDLADGKIDVALMALPWDISGFVTREIGLDYFYFVSRPENIKQSHPMMSLSELKEFSLLMLEEGHCLRDHAILSCQLSPPSRQEELLATSLTTLIHMVAGGLGSTLLPEMAIRAKALIGTGLEAYPLKDKTSFRRIALVWRPSSGINKSLEQLAVQFETALSLLLQQPLSNSH